MRIALFCLVGLGPAIAIKVVTRPASLTFEAAQDQIRTETALAPNEAAKADRLPLRDFRAETEVMPAGQPQPSETPPTGPGETVSIPGRRWQDANARALPGESLPRTGPGVDTDDGNTSNNETERPSRFNRNGKGSRLAPSERPRHAIAKRPVESAGNGQPKPREVWHCRQDAMGSVLRSLDLSPRCNM
jgi:hypothetical protein